jgi:hypothetical protein
MKPPLLHRQLVTNRAEFKDKPAEFFKRKAENVSKTSNIVHNFTQSSKVALETSYELSLLAGKNKSAYTATESVIVSGALITVDKMLDKKSANAVKTIASSDTTLSRRIRDMARDVVEQITENIKIDQIFAIQIDESMNVSDETELLVYIRYFNVKKGAF